MGEELPAHGDVHQGTEIADDDAAATVNFSGHPGETEERHWVLEGAGMMEQGGQRLVDDENDRLSYPRNPSINQLKGQSADVPFKNHLLT